MNEFEQRLVGVFDALNETFEMDVQLENGRTLGQRADAPVTADDQANAENTEQTVTTDVPMVTAAVEVPHPVQHVPDEDCMVTKVTITDLKQGVDRSAFVERFCELFGPLVEQMSDGRKAVVYEEGRGLTIRRVDEDEP